MRPLAALERFFERLFERPAARLFRARLQPVQVQRKIERAMETERLSGADRPRVPNRFRVHLHPDDLGSFDEMTGTLASELADGALAFARSHGYAVADRPRVELVEDRRARKGDIRVDARFADPEPAASAAAPADAPAAGESGRPSTNTMVFSVPVAQAPVARLREVQPDGTEREIGVDGAALTIGRASDNQLVLNDARVSRHHARLQPRGGTLVFTDIGSTNGSRVNGVRVGEIVLGEGDRIEIGDTVLIVESVVRG
jgi:hypothetical protein